MGLLGHKQHWMGISKLIGTPKCALKIKEKARLIVIASRVCVAETFDRN